MWPYFNVYLEGHIRQVCLYKDNITDVHTFVQVGRDVCVCFLGYCGFSSNILHTLFMMTSQWKFWNLSYCWSINVGSTSGNIITCEINQQFKSKEILILNHLISITTQCDAILCMTQLIKAQVMWCYYQCHLNTWACWAVCWKYQYNKYICFNFIDN